MKRRLLIGLLGISLICGCGKPKTDELDVSVYKMSVPTSWTLNETNHTTSWDYYLEKSDTCMAEVRIVLTDISADNIYDYDEFVTVMGDAMEGYAGNFDACDFGSAKERSINDITALEYDLSGRTNNVNFTGEMVILPVSNYSKMVTVNFTQTEGCKEDHSEDFNTFVESIKA